MARARDYLQSVLSLKPPGVNDFTSSPSAHVLLRLVDRLLRDSQGTGNFDGRVLDTRIPGLTLIVFGPDEASVDLSHHKTTSGSSLEQLEPRPWFFILPGPMELELE